MTKFVKRIINCIFKSFSNKCMKKNADKLNVIMMRNENFQPKKKNILPETKSYEREKVSQKMFRTNRNNANKTN